MTNFVFQKYFFAYNVQSGLMGHSRSGKNLVELAIAIADKA